MAEVIYFEDPSLDIGITSRRATFEDATYPIWAIASVRVLTVAPRFRRATLLAFGIVCLLFGVCGILGFWRESTDTALGFLDISAVLFCAMVFIGRTVRDRHILMLSTVQGDMPALDCLSRGAAHAAANAISQAISDRASTLSADTLA